MAYEILSHNAQTLPCCQQMYLLGKLTFQFSQLRSIQIASHFQSGSYLIIDFRILQVLKLLSPILIIQGHCGFILYGSLKVIDTHISTKSTCCDVREQWRTCEADTMSRWQHMHQVVCKDTVLCTMGLVAHHNDVVVWIDGVCIGIIKFLNQREDKRGITLQFRFQILTTAGDKRLSFYITQQSAILKGITDLLVQFFAISQNQECRRACKLPANLLGQEQHGIALTTTLCMPEHTQFSIQQLTILIFLYGLVYTQILVVTSQNLGYLTSTMIIEYKVLQQVEEVLFRADTLQHGG